MSELALISSWCLTAVFVVSAVAKLLDPTGTADAVVDFGVPARLRRLAPLLPLVELALAVLLIVPSTARWGAIGALVLLLIFSAAITLNLARGRRPDCNCFGRSTTGPIGGRTLVRNGVLVLLALAAAHPDPVRPGEVFDRVSVPAALGITALVMVVVALTGLGWLVLELWRQQARLLVRIDALEADAANAPVGLTAPDVSGHDASGESISLSELRSPGRHTLVVFGDPNCHACITLEPELGSWLHDDPDRRHIVVVSHSVDMPLPDGAALFVETGRAASIAHGVSGTPSAMLVDGDGMIASPLAEGADAVRALLAEPLPVVDSVRFRPRPAKAGQELIGQGLDSALTAIDGTDSDVVLVFWNEHCHHCRAMTEALLDRLDRPVDERPRAVFVVPSAEQAHTVAERLPGAGTLIDTDLRTNLAVGVPGTPSAALVRDRRLVVDLAVGPDAVLAVLDRAATVEAAIPAARAAIT